MKNKRTFSLKIIISLLLLCSCLGGIIFYSHFYTKVQRNQKEDAITIAVLQDPKISDLDTNYYKEWLEEQIGYDICFTYITPGYEKEYLNAMLKTEYNTVDAVFLPKKQNILTKEEFQNYVDSGLILDLADYTTKESNLSQILVDYEAEQVDYYYFPSIDTSRKSKNMQIFWINVGWLKKLKLEVPRTVQELTEVLQLFKESDPNENGIMDEIPLISSEEEYALCSYYYLINAFIYYNPYKAGIYQDSEGKVLYVPLTEEFRTGIEYASELSSPNNYSKKQLMELVNSPQDLVGAFTSQSIADVIYANCDDILARYIQVAPLRMGDGTANAVECSYQWNIGGYIPANSKHPEEAVALMDLMLSEKASLIAEFGEEGVDWQFSQHGDLSTYGARANITTLNYLKDSIQNKNFAGMGPQVLKEEYVNDVTWNGDNSLVEYMDARAVQAYEPYYKETAKRKLKGYDEERIKELQEYLSDQICRFIKGEQDIKDDTAWDGFCKKYRRIVGE